MLKLTSMAAKALCCWRDSPSSGMRSWGPPRMKVLLDWPSLIMSPTLSCRTLSASGHALHALHALLPLGVQLPHEN